MGLNTSSKSSRGQFDNRGYSTEVIYSSSDQKCEFRDDKTRQMGTGESWTSAESEKNA